VLHNGIYKKLLDRGAPVTSVHLLKNWYHGMVICVVVCIGTMYWESHLLLNVVSVKEACYRRSYLLYYIDDLILQLKQSGHGIYIGQLFVGCVCADNIALLSA